MEKTWCAGCFVCSGCESQFTAESGFHEHQERPYCQDCYAEVALPKCAGCLGPIKTKAVKAMDKDWCVGCFVCKVRNWNSMTTVKVF